DGGAGGGADGRGQDGEVLEVVGPRVALGVVERDAAGRVEAVGQVDAEATVGGDGVARDAVVGVAEDGVAEKDPSAPIGEDGVGVDRPVEGRSYAGTRGAHAVARVEGDEVAGTGVRAADQVVVGREGRVVAPEDPPVHTAAA